MTETIHQTYVFEDCEVRVTGRRATKQLKSGKLDELVEITPVSSITGTWKKWVRFDTLFEVCDHP
jgi:hypothetical protein